MIRSRTQRLPFSLLYFLLWGFSSFYPAKFLFSSQYREQAFRYPGFDCEELGDGYAYLRIGNKKVLINPQGGIAYPCKLPKSETPKKEMGYGSKYIHKGIVVKFERQPRQKYRSPLSAPGVTPCVKLHGESPSPQVAPIFLASPQPLASPTHSASLLLGLSYTGCAASTPSDTSPYYNFPSNSFCSSHSNSKDRRESSPLKMQPSFASRNKPFSFRKARKHVSCPLPPKALEEFQSLMNNIALRAPASLLHRPPRAVSAPGKLQALEKMEHPSQKRAAQNKQSVYAFF